MCVCIEKIAILMLVSGETRGFVLQPQSVYVCKYMFAVYVPCERWDERDEEKVRADPAVIDCWTWLYSKSLPL